MMDQDEVALLKDRLTHLHNLRKQYTQNLATLELQEAQYGIDCPLHIINNIANIQNKLANIARERTALAQELRGATSVRRFVESNELRVLVQQELALHIERHDTFTAYDITLALRATHPSLEIIHTSVRDSIHEQMQQLVTQGSYKRERRQYADAAALTYIPSDDT
jgi:hypothetical protein